VANTILEEGVAVPAVSYTRSRYSQEGAVKFVQPLRRMDDALSSWLSGSVVVDVLVALALALLYRMVRGKD
jgi:hypothetical protein